MWSALLVVGLGIWLGLHASSAGLTEGWKEAVRKEFARQGIPISIGKLTLDPLHGLVARDVRIYEQSETSGHEGSVQAGSRVLADISRIDLDVSLPKLLQGQVDLKSLNIRDASASLPVDPDQPDGERLELSECHARVLLSADSVEIQELRGRIFGLLVSVNGELVRRPKGEKEKNDPLDKKKGWLGLTEDKRETLRRATKALSLLQSPKGAPPELRIRAMADLGRMEEGRFEFSFRAPQVAWEGLQIEEVVLVGHYDNGLLQAEDIRFRDEGGSFRAEIDFVRASRELRFNVESHALLPELVRQRLWPERWPKLFLTKPPSLTAGGKLVFEKDVPKPVGLVTGSLAIGQTTVDQTTFEYASANVAWDGRKLFLRDLNLRESGGVLKADLMFQDMFLQARGQSTIHPESLAPLIPPSYTKRLLSSFDCPDAGRTAIGFTVEGSFRDPWSWSVDTRFEVADIIFHGVPVKEAAGIWRMLPGGSHVFREGFIRIPAGATTGIGTPAKTTRETTARLEEITLSPPTGPTTFKGVRCQGWPHTVVAAIVPEVMRALPKFTLTAPADLTVNGLLGGKTGPKSDLKITGTTQGTVFYPAFGKQLPLEQPTALVLVKDRSAILPSLTANCYGGKVSGNLRFDELGSPNGPSSGKLMLEQVGYQDLISLFSDSTDEEKGSVDVNMGFICKDGTLRGLEADGAMRLTNGDLFSIPLFGPLSPLVEAVLPDIGLGYSVASVASGTCAVRDGLLTTNDFNAQTPAFKMDGKGTIDLPTGKVEFNARFNARGIAELATVVFSYIFEYKCEGTLAEPKWRPLHIPKIPLPKIPLPGRAKNKE